MPVDAAGREYVDSSSPEPEDLVQYRLGNAAVAGSGFFKAWHVTDDPSRLIVLVHARRRVDAQQEHEGRELGSGLYVSAVPHYWTGRSTRKWEALRRLSKAQVEAIAREILDSPKFQGPGYLTARELERARQKVTDWVDGDEYGILEVSGQPYNVDVFAILRRMGLPTFESQEVQVTFHGRYVTLGRRLAQGEARSLRATGYDGAFNKGGMSVNPELVIWDVTKIDTIG